MRPALTTFALLVAASLGGCGVFIGNKKPLPPPMEYTIQSPYGEVRTYAIAPTINLSGSRDFDPLVVSDTLYAELQQVQGLNVLPLNKTLLAMQRLHIRNIDDVKAAQKLAEALGADGLVVPAITAYDPYNPPVVGMILQLYTSPQAVAEVSPAALRETARSNPAGPMIVSDVNPGALGNIGRGAGSGSPLSAADVGGGAGAERQPVSQVSAVFNSTNQTVLRELQVFAAGRTEYDSALSDHKFLLDSDSYMRFVAHAMVRRLMDVERTRSSDR